MKNFYDVLYTKSITENVEDLPTIYCDMDMVLCDFLKGAEEVLGTSFIKADKTKRCTDYICKERFLGFLRMDAWVKENVDIY